MAVFDSKTSTQIEFTVFPYTPNSVNQPRHVHKGLLAALKFQGINKELQASNLSGLMHCFWEKEKTLALQMKSKHRLNSSQWNQTREPTEEEQVEQSVERTILSLMELESTVWPALAWSCSWRA